ncbi:hypothetical protein HDV00_003349 [Rhizophlyctis rosea]|nr:hypothetical protein HDV00_003349 [Rhizophlyctis rosea]
MSTAPQQPRPRTKLQLPPELLAQLLRYLLPTELPHVRRVCYEFERAVHFHLTHVILKRFEPSIALSFPISDSQARKDIITITRDNFLGGFDEEYLPVGWSQFSQDVKDAVFTASGFRCKWETVLLMNADGTEVSLGYLNDLSDLYAMWQRHSAITVEVALEPIPGIWESKYYLPERVVLINEDIGLARLKCHSSIVADDESYTLMYSVEDLPNPNFRLLLLGPVTCPTEAIYKVLLSHFYLDQLTRICAGNVLVEHLRTAAWASVTSSLSRYTQTFAKANIDIGALSFRCRSSTYKVNETGEAKTVNCNFAGKEWGQIEDHLWDHHWVGIAEQLRYYGEEEGFDPVRRLVEWRVKKDSKSRYAFKLP